MSGSDPHRLLVDLLADSRATVVARLDADGAILWANLCLTRLLDHDPAGQLLTDYVAEGQRSRLEALIAAAPARGWTRGHFGIVKASDAVPIDLVISATDDPIGSLIVGERAVDGVTLTTELMSEMADDLIAEQRQLAREVIRLAGLSETDALTGLLNRRALLHGLDRINPLTGTSTPLSVAMVDLDHFKAINDTLGHAVGDRVLAAVAAALRSSVRREDLVGRYGGEEFVVVLPDCGAEAARERADRMLADLRDLGIDGVERGVTASIGLVTAHAPVATSELLARADSAMYRAKAQGRNRVVGPDPEPSSDAAAKPEHA